MSVIGSGAEHERDAEEVGRLLAERGATLVCGGKGEVMAAAARGAKSAGGTTIGILPGDGTLAEIGFALRLGRRVVILEPGWEVEGAMRARTPHEAVELALS